MNSKRLPWKTIIDGLGKALVLTDANFTLLSLNGEALGLFRTNLSSAAGRPLMSLFAGENESLATGFRQLARDAACGRKPRFREFNALASRADGTVFDAQITLSAFHHKDNKLGGFAVLVDDISDHSRSFDDLRLSSQVFTHSGEPMLITGPADRIVSINRAFTEIIGYDEQEVMDRSPRFLRENLTDTLTEREIWESVTTTGHWSGEVINRKKNGEVYPAWLSISVVRNDYGDILHYISIFSDISSHSHELRKFRHLAHHDHLTRLPNRSLLEDRFQQAVARYTRHGGGRQIALLFVDLNNFKVVNDHHGHAVGDRLLKAIANGIAGIMRSEDTVCRYGGDEFVILLSQIEGASAVELTAARVQTAVSESCRELTRTAVTASIGISLYPDHGRRLETLLERADAAMYRNKNGNNGALP